MIFQRQRISLVAVGEPLAAVFRASLRDVFLFEKPKKVGDSRAEGSFGCVCPRVQLCRHLR